MKTTAKTINNSKKITIYQKIKKYQEAYYLNKNS